MPSAILRCVDLFAGCGGFSTGAVRALGKLGLEIDLLACNHNPRAIATHRANHPQARHEIVDLLSEAAQPERLVPGGIVDLLLASPSCVFFSRARGGKPIHDQQRTDPWTIVMWLTRLRVKHLLMENVAEAMRWGPVATTTGRPIKAREGEYFRAWVSAIRALGYRVEWRVLCAADYGDPTTRERLFVQAAANNGRIYWPEATHSVRPSVSLFGTTERWRGAREILDWSNRGQSIFARRKPLAPKTMRRIAIGLHRHSGAWGQVLLEVLAAKGLLDRTTLHDVRRATPAGTPRVTENDQAGAFLTVFRGTGTARVVDTPLPTLTASGEHLALATLTHERVVQDAAMTLGQHGCAVCRPVSEPIATLATRGAVRVFVPTVAPGTAGGEGVVVEVDGVLYRVDLRFRMLTVRELARAMSFDDDTETYTFTGTKTDQVRGIGNAVPVRTATALIAAAVRPEAERRGTVPPMAGPACLVARPAA
ncbi:MAG: DNA cytosine methyltransferase [Gemmatimonadaceae bacterium]|nr:DNA cytosine methyltransferase [Gemmatimonadaceae bacterium]